MKKAMLIQTAIVGVSLSVGALAATVETAQSPAPQKPVADQANVSQAAPAPAAAPSSVATAPRPAPAPVVQPPAVAASAPAPTPAPTSATNAGQASVTPEQCMEYHHQMMMAATPQERSARMAEYAQQMHACVMAQANQSRSRMETTQQEVQAQMRAAEERARQAAAQWGGPYNGAGEMAAPNQNQARNPWATTYGEGAYGYGGEYPYSRNPWAANEGYGVPGPNQAQNPWAANGNYGGAPYYTPNGGEDWQGYARGPHYAYEYGYRYVPGYGAPQVYWHGECPDCPPGVMPPEMARNAPGPKTNNPPIMPPCAITP